MEIVDFNKLIITNERSAVNFMSFLIGYKFTTEDADSGLAILSIYDGLSPDLVKDKKDYSDLFYKFFLNYKISEDNLKYYQEFASTWSSDKKDLVKTLNPNWKGDWIVEDFKNSQLFFRAASLKKDMVLVDFLQDNQETVLELLKKDTKVFIKNFVSSGVLRVLIWSNFNYFLEFAEKYKLDSVDLFSQTFPNSQGMKYIIGYVDNAYNSRLAMKFMKENKNLIEEKINYFKRSRSQSDNILDGVKTLYDQRDKAVLPYVICLFQDEINEAVRSSGAREFFDIVDSTTWGKNGGDFKYVFDSTKNGMAEYMPEILRIVSNIKLNEDLLRLEIESVVSPKKKKI